MAASLKLLWYEKEINTATPVTQDLLGFGFNPSWYIIGTTSTDSVTDNIRSSIGFCDSQGNMRCVSYAVSDDAGSGGNPTTTRGARRDITTHVLAVMTGTGGAPSTAIEHGAYITDGIRITYTSNNTSAWRFWVLAGGGADFTDSAAITFNTATSTGNQNVNTVGFDPDAVILINTGAANGLNNVDTDCVVNFGFACSPSRQFATSNVSRDGLSTSDAYRVQRLGSCFVSLSDSGSTVIRQASFNGKLGNETGFSLNHTVASSVSVPVFALCIKGGAWDIQSVQTRTSPGTQTITTSQGFAPKAVLAVTNDSTSELVGSGLLLGIGAATSAQDRYSTWNGELDNSAPTVAARSSSNAALIQTRQVNATGANSIITRDIDFDSFTSTGAVLNYITAAPGTVYINTILVGDTIVGATTVEREWGINFNVRQLVEKEVEIGFQTGGAVSVGPFRQAYNIQGVVEREWGIVFNVLNYVEKEIEINFDVAMPSTLVERQWGIHFNVIGLVEREWGFSFGVTESPDLNLSGYMKPYKARIFIMNYAGTETYSTYDAFDFEATNIEIAKLRFSLHRDSADDFEIIIDDSNLMIDTTRVSEGCSVLIQVAKRSTEIGDGNHDVLWGYMRTKRVHRPANNVLSYVFRGYGASIRTMERLVDFRDEARRKSHSSAEPDPTDTKMEAHRLFERLFSDRSVYPFRRPLERQFDTSQITSSTSNQDVKVDTFIPLIDQYMVEIATAANFIADNSGAVWGIDRRKRPYIKYPLAEKTDIILKSTMDKTDDRFKTGYILEPPGFDFEDSIEKGDGYFNCLFAITGTKEATSNVFNLTAIRDRYDSLALDEPPSDAVDPEVISGIGPVIPLYNPDPNSAVWDELANLAKQWPINAFYVIIQPYSGNTGFDSSLSDAVRDAWNTTIDKLQDAVATGIFVLGWLDTENSGKSISQVKEEIDEYALNSQVDGVMFHNMSTSLSDVSYYNEITEHAKTKFRNRGLSQNKFFVFANAGNIVPQEFYTGTNIDRFIIHDENGLPDIENEMQAWYNEFGPFRRVVWASGITTAVEGDIEIKNWVKEASDTSNFAKSMYITEKGSTPRYSTISTRFAAMMEQLDASAARSLQGSGHAPPGRAIQQDLGMSFIAQSPRTSDLIIILSKIGNPISEPGENLNRINGGIVGNRVVQITTTDEAGTVITREEDMPDYDKSASVAWFNIPFDEVGTDTPTIHFLHKTITKPNVQVGQRYWVWLRGRGQDASNTFRWHHGDHPMEGYKSARRIPSAGAYNSAHWDVFSNETHPGFALTYMQNTTHLSMAMNSDAIHRDGEVDELVDLSDITDQRLVWKVMHSMLMEGSQVKRVIRIPMVTVPDNPILPDQIVTIIDDLSENGITSGGMAGGTQAEITDVDYEADPENPDLDPEGIAYVGIRAVTSYNKSFAVWKAKMDRGEWNIDFPPVPDINDRPLPDTQAPVVRAIPKGKTYRSPVSVRFIVSEDSTIVYYTTDGTNPVVEQSAIAGTQTATVSNTELYFPGESAEIVIDKTTQLRFMGVDERNNRTAVYLENYKIEEDGKAIAAVFYQDTGLSAAQIASSFSGVVRETLDYATLHKRIEEPINSTWENAVLSLPTKYQEVEFQSYDQMAAYVGTAKSKGFDIIGYNIERDDSPDTDTDNPVKSVKRFAERVRKEGLLVRLNPRHDYTARYAGRFAKYADIYNIQAHWYQHDSGDFNRFVKNTVQSLKANNANIIISVTLSAALKQQDSEKGKSRLETLISSWIRARRNGVDICRVFFKTDGEFNSIVVPFLNWFNTNGRSLG